MPMHQSMIMNNVTSEYTRILSSDIRNILKQLPHYQRPRGIIIQISTLPLMMENLQQI